MKFVSSESRIKEILDRIRQPEFYGCETLIVSFKTTAEFVESILPPPLKPMGEPMVSI